MRLADDSSLKSIKITCGELHDILEFNKSLDRHLDYEENTRHVTKGNSFPSSSLIPVYKFSYANVRNICITKHALEYSITVGQMEAATWSSEHHSDGYNHSPDVYTKRAPCTNYLFALITF